MTKKELHNLINSLNKRLDLNERANIKMFTSITETFKAQGDVIHTIKDYLFNKFEKGKKVAKKINSKKKK